MKRNDKNCLKIDDETMAAFVEGMLDNKKQAMIQKHMRTCSQCFESMIRLRKSLSERESMPFVPTPAELFQKAKDLVPGEKVRRPVFEGIREKIMYCLFPQSIWRLAPVVAGAVVIVLAIFLLQPQPPIQNFSLGSQLIISEPGPLGFVGDREVRDYKGMKVALSEDGENLIFTWPKIEGAVFYHIILVFDDEQHRITPDLGINEPQFSYPATNIQMNKKYEWEVTGKLGDGRSFIAKAEFKKK